MTFWSAGGRQARAVLREGESASQLPQCSVGAVSLQPVEQQQQRSDVSDHPPSDRSLDSTSRISAWVLAVICCLVFVFFKRSGGAFRAPSIISVALSLSHSLTHHLLLQHSSSCPPGGAGVRRWSESRSRVVNISAPGPRRAVTDTAVMSGLADPPCVCKFNAAAAAAGKPEWIQSQRQTPPTAPCPLFLPSPLFSLRRDLRLWLQLVTTRDFFFDVFSRLID